MSRNLKSQIIRLRNEGYRIWRIAELANVSANDVMEVLVDAGIVPLEIVETRLACEQKPTRESTRKSLLRIREGVSKYNRARRIGGGNWSGR